jgi:hypothetical protein
MARLDDWWHGEASQGVSVAQNSTAVSNCSSQRAHRRGGLRRRFGGAGASAGVGGPGGASWGSGGSSARLRWRWSVVECRSRGGAEARRGGARRSGMEAALGFMAAQLSELVGAGAAAGVKKGRAGDCGMRARGEGRGNLGRTLRLCGEDGADGVGPTGQRERGDAEAAKAGADVWARVASGEEASAGGCGAGLARA